VPLLVLALNWTRTRNHEVRIPSRSRRTSRHSSARPKHNVRMPDDPLTRDAWVAAFVHELIALRPDLTYSFKYATAVAQNEWSRKGRSEDPKVAVSQWNQRVRSARP